MKTSTMTLLASFLASPAFAHADAQLHVHGFEAGTVMATTGLVLATAATACWAIFR